MAGQELIPHRGRLSDESKSVGLSSSENLVNINSNVAGSKFEFTKAKDRKLDYTLNQETSLKKKLECARREENVRIEETEGGTRIYFQAGAWEVFRAAISEYYRTFSVRGFKCEFERHTDSKQNVQGEIIKVIPTTEAKVKSGGYTINIYHTKCSILVNGKGYEKFRKTDLTKIQKEIVNAKNNGLVDPVSLNNAIKEALEQALANHNHLTTDKQGGAKISQNRDKQKTIQASPDEPNSPGSYPGNSPGSKNPSGRCAAS